MSLPAFDESFVPTYTAPPNPSWKLGDAPGATAFSKQWLEAGEKAGYKVIDTSEVSPHELYALMISGIIPRPIGLVSSMSESGVENLAPFSFFNMLTPFPPTIMISLTNLPRVKDTARNLLATRQFTVNIVSEAWVENANVAALDLPEEGGEWALSGLTKAQSVMVRPPRVKESAFSMECETAHVPQLWKHIDISPPGFAQPANTLFLGTVKRIHVRQDILNERGVVDPRKLRPVARLGDVSYARLGEVFRLPRYLWEDQKEEVERFLGERKEGGDNEP
ncbi:hypothetical protein CALVIDRAFT_557684 [Calocera viscosa TUFC12733]|uniref:Flavin reductase like domain-containing protein n=1 Tax=Calocera viscosa (strain TUFC12733) TaxID=1330018 RepID=A0A167I541_CALVF|nr:hypothetical protein CALVIDRAFT_557684 [Calocera viscosa TUFC12733]